MNMRLKQYLRGLGIGIVVTAVFLGSVMNGKNSVLTDDEIKARAKELGMHEEVFLDDIETTVTPSLTKPDISTEEPIVVSAEEPTVAPTKEPTIVPTKEPAVVPSQEPSSVENGESAFVVLKIKQGDSSNAVAEQLFLLEVVDDEVAFDAYLCANGYDKKIKVGTYEIPKQGTYEAIAKIISTN